MTGQTENTFLETATPHQGPIKQAEVIIVAEETILIQTLALLLPTTEFCN